MEKVVITNNGKPTFVGKVNALLEWITDNGQSVIAELLNVDFTHEADKKFL